MLNFFDYLVILIYFLILSFIGFYFSKRQKSIDDYFKGGGRIPSWAAGISIFGTALSPITFLAIPAKTYSTCNFGALLVLGLGAPARISHASGNGALLAGLVWH